MSSTGGGSYHSAMGEAIARQAAGRPLPSAAVLEGLADDRRRRRLRRKLAVARFLRFVR